MMLRYVNLVWPVGLGLGLRIWANCAERRDYAIAAGQARNAPTVR